MVSAMADATDLWFNFWLWQVIEEFQAMQPTAKKLCNEWPRFRTGVINAAKRLASIDGDLQRAIEAAEDDHGMGMWFT